MNGTHHVQDAALYGDTEPRRGNKIVRCDCGARVYAHRLPAHQATECSVRIAKRTQSRPRPIGAEYRRAR